MRSHLYAYVRHALPGRLNLFILLEVARDPGLDLGRLGCLLREGGIPEQHVLGGRGHVLGTRARQVHLLRQFSAPGHPRGCSWTYAARTQAASTVGGLEECPHWWTGASKGSVFILLMDKSAGRM